MAAWVWIIIAIAALAAVCAVAWAAWRRRRSGALRQTFGPEYERTVNEAGDRRRGESELDARRKRRQKLDIRPLTPAARQRYSDEWQNTQARFVDDPRGAIREADRLVGDLMETRGYPMGDFEQRAADISVNHPKVVTNYRAAHRVAVSSDEGKADTENLRTAMVHYRALFEELLETPINLADRREERYRARAS